MEKIELKPATEADIILLVNLGRQTFSEAFSAQNSAADMQQYLAETFTAEKLQQEFYDANSVFILAFAGAEPAGYAKFRFKPLPGSPILKKALELERLYVLAQFQNQKIGAAFMNYFLAFARKNQAEIAWLGVWEHNLKAQKFYRSFGFEVVSKHIFILGTDAQTDLLMKLAL